MPSPRVTVIIPAFNAETFLAETLTSVAAQSFNDFEAIVIDDGSADRTRQIAEEFCQRDGRFRVIHQRNQGVSVARNRGMDEARGEYVAFLDADDVWLPEKLTRQMEILQREPQANFVFTNCVYWDGRKALRLNFKERHKLPAGRLDGTLAFSNPFIPSVALIRRSLVTAGCRFDPQWSGCADWDLWLQFMEQHLYVAGTREPLVNYRQWEGNMSARKLDMLVETVAMLKFREQRARTSELSAAYRRAIAHAQARLELARARQCVDTQPAEIPGYIWRAWQNHPRRLKWLFWLALVRWPRWLGGRFTRGVVYRKLITKF